MVFARTVQIAVLGRVVRSTCSSLLKAFWVGLRFDLRVSLLFALATLPWLFLPRFSAVNYPLLRRFLGVWFGLGLF